MLTVVTVTATGIVCAAESETVRVHDPAATAATVIVVALTVAVTTPAQPDAVYGFVPPVVAMVWLGFDPAPNARLVGLTESGVGVGLGVGVGVGLAVDVAVGLGLGVGVGVGVGAGLGLCVGVGLGLATGVDGAAVGLGLAAGPLEVDVGRGLGGAGGLGLATGANGIVLPPPHPARNVANTSRTIVAIQNALRRPESGRCEWKPSMSAVTRLVSRYVLHRFGEWNVER